MLVVAVWASAASGCSGYTQSMEHENNARMTTVDTTLLTHKQMPVRVWFEMGARARTVHTRMNRGTTEAVCIECTLHTTLLWLSWHLVLRPIYCGHRWHSEWLRRMLDGFCDDAVPMAADSTNCGWLTWIYFLFGRSCDAYAANKITFSVLLLLEIMMLFLAIEVTIALRTSVFIYKSWRSYYKKNPAISIFSQFDLIISPLMRLVLRQFPSICFASTRARTQPK